MVYLTKNGYLFLGGGGWVRGQSSVLMVNLSFTKNPVNHSVPESQSPCCDNLVKDGAGAIFILVSYWRFGFSQEQCFHFAFLKQIIATFLFAWALYNHCLDINQAIKLFRNDIFLLNGENFGSLKTFVTPITYQL